jgi:hypothetical protein
MFIFDHAKDIWYLVISLCAITVTTFISLILYHVMQAAREVEQAASGIKRQVDHIEEVITSFRTKVMSYVSYAAIAGQVAKKVTEYLKSDDHWPHKNKKTAKKGKTTDESDDKDGFSSHAF